MKQSVLMGIFIVMSHFISGQSIDSIQNDEESFIIIEKQAEFPGGTKEFKKYIKQNRKYPSAKKKRGVIWIQFVVTAGGQIEKASIRILPTAEIEDKKERSRILECEDYQKEAIRLIEQSPDWIPARSGKKAEKQKIHQKISF